MNFEQPEKELTAEEIIDLAQEEGITFENPSTADEIGVFARELDLGREEVKKALRFSLNENNLISKNDRNNQIGYMKEYFTNETRDKTVVFLPRKPESEGIARHGVKEFFYGKRELSAEEEIEKDDILLSVAELLQNAVRYGREGSEYIALACSKENNKAKEVSIMNFVNKNKEIPPETLNLFDSCSGLSENESEEKIKNDFEKETDDFLNNIIVDFEHKRGLKLVCAFCEVDFKRIEDKEGDICYKFTLRHRPEEQERKE